MPYDNLSRGRIAMEKYRRLSRLIKERITCNGEQNSGMVKVSQLTYITASSA